MKIKIFTDDNTADLENSINEWLAKNQKISINHMLQSESDGGGEGQWAVTISIWYLEF